MTKKQIRTHYSGVIIFGAKLLTVATGIVFAVIVANSLSPTEYGILGIFNIIIPYFTLLSTPIPFWTMRFVARGTECASKTGVFANMSLAVITTLIYLALLPVISPAFGLQNYLTVYLIMGGQVVEIYLITVMESCLQGNQPEFVGYGLIIGEIFKLALCYVFVIQQHWAISGVALSIIAAYAIKVGFYVKIIFNELRQKIVFAYVREWVKGSAFNIYNIIGDRIAAILFLMLTIYGTEIAAGYYYATSQIANIIGYSSFLAYALTPKLLADKKVSEATLSLKLVLMFAVPMTMGVLTLPGSYLMFLKESGEYVVATPVLMILAIDALILTASSFFSYVLFGIEKADENAKVPFWKMARSKIFVFFSLPYLHAAITLPATLYTLTAFAHNNPLQVAIYVIGINSIGHAVTFSILYYIVRKAVKLEVPWSNIAKYVTSSVIMASAVFLIHPAGRLATLIATGIGGTVYVSLLLAIDKDTRVFAQDSLNMLKSKIKHESEAESLV